MYFYTLKLPTFRFKNNNIRVRNRTIIWNQWLYSDYSRPCSISRFVNKACILKKNKWNFILLPPGRSHHLHHVHHHVDSGAHVKHAALLHAEGGLGGGRERLSTLRPAWSHLHVVVHLWVLGNTKISIIWPMIICTTYDSKLRTLTCNIGNFMVRCCTNTKPKTFPIFYDWVVLFHLQWPIL